MEKTDFRSDCPVASTLDLIGDKWTLLILRDMLFGASRFSDFLESPEGFKRNILTDRLKKLTERGLVYRVPYQDNPPRHHYHVTPTGAALLPVIQEIAKWGAENLSHTYEPPEAMLDMTPEDLVPSPGTD